MYFYDLDSYGSMIRDDVRTGAYAKALRESVKPESVVLDMGTGVGIWALLACQFGARRVYAIDPNDVIQIAREFAAANGCADRIEFIQEMSTRVTLPEPADVIVHEMHGVLPMFEQNLVSIIDARRRLLAPGGRMIPEREVLWASVVELPESHTSIATPWSANPYGLDMRAAIRAATNTWRKPKQKVTPEQFLVEPKHWATLDYAVLENPNVRGGASWSAGRRGIGHGLLVWFDTFLLDGVSFSNSPSAPQMIFGNAFFPWPEAISICVGDTISVEIRADLVANDYVWGWDTLVLEEGDSNRVKANLKQSTFFSGNFSTGRLRKRASYHVPPLNEEGEIDRLALSLMDSEHSLEQIAKQLTAQFSIRFANWYHALSHVGSLAEKYSR